MTFRRNVTPSAFGKDKLKEGNLKQNKEAVHDITMGYGIAAVQESVKSAFFSKSDELNSCNDITNALLINFKMFLSESAKLLFCLLFRSINNIRAFARVVLRKCKIWKWNFT